MLLMKQFKVKWVSASINHQPWSKQIMRQAGKTETTSNGVEES